MVSLDGTCCRYFYLAFTDRFRHNDILKEIYIQFLEPTPKINKNAASEADWMWCLREAAMCAAAVAHCKDHHLHPIVKLDKYKFLLINESFSPFTVIRRRKHLSLLDGCKLFLL